MEKEIQLLSDWLKEQNHIPAKRVRKETLLDIAGIDHLENHWSYIYMYFHYCPVKVDCCDNN